MKLLYIYIQFLNKKGVPQQYRNFDELELNFSTTVKFSYDAAKNTLRFSERRIPLPDHFWTNNSLGSDYQNIYNINVIAGVNGSGKTTAIHCVMEMLDCFHSLAETGENDDNRKEYGNRALIVLEQNGEEYLLDYSPSTMNELRNVQLDASLRDKLIVFSCHGKQDYIGLRIVGRNAFTSALLKTKVAYITNTLSQYDYENVTKEQIRPRQRFIYDVSLGGMIGSDILQFFLFEIFKQVKYVFDEPQIGRRRELQKLIHELTLPNTLKLHLRFDVFQSALNGFLLPFFDKSGGPFELTLKYFPLPHQLKILCIAAYAEDLGQWGQFDMISQLSTLQTEGTDPDLGQKQPEYGKYLNSIEYAFCSTLFKLNLNEHTKKITVLSAMDDKWLISGSADNTLKVWNTSSGKRTVTFDMHKAEITCLTVLSGGCVVSGSADGILMVWDASTGKKKKSLRKVKKSVTCIARISDQKIVSGYADGALRVWNIVSGSCIQESTEQTGKITCVACLPNGEIVSGSVDGTIQFWDLAENTKTKKKVPNVITCMSILSNGRVVCGLVEGSIQVWNPSTYSIIGTCEGDGADITCIDEIDENVIAAGYYNGLLRIWDVSRERPLQTYDEHTRTITCVSHIGDKQIISASRDQTIRIWNYETGETIQKMVEHRADIPSLTVLPDGRIASGDGNGEIIVWISKKNMLSDFVTTSNIAQFARERREKCEQYLEFIQNNTELFSLFSKTADNTYTLSLDVKNKTVDTNKAMVQFLQKYRDACYSTYTIDFDWGLSSGEDNMLRIFSNLFHLLSYGRSEERRIYNLHSMGSRMKPTVCDTLLVFLDEADLTLHPEWQRRFIAILTAYIPSIFPASCVKDIQLVLTTHSPLMLGDIPGENITYLLPDDMINKNVQHQRSVSELALTQTFGQNIHTILMNSFFLNRTIGQFAYQKIIDIADELKELNRAQKNAEDPMKLHEMQEKCQQYKCIIECIGDPIIRNKLMNMYSACFESSSNQMDIQKKLMQIQELSETASEKERESMISDLEKVVSSLRLKGRSDLS